MRTAIIIDTISTVDNESIWSVGFDSRRDGRSPVGRRVSAMVGRAGQNWLKISQKTTLTPLYRCKHPIRFLSCQPSQLPVPSPSTVLPLEKLTCLPGENCHVVSVGERVVRIDVSQKSFDIELYGRDEVSLHHYWCSMIRDELGSRQQPERLTRRGYHSCQDSGSRNAGKNTLIRSICSHEINARSRNGMVHNTYKS